MPGPEPATYRSVTLRYAVLCLVLVSVSACGARLAPPPPPPVEISAGALSPTSPAPTAGPPPAAVGCLPSGVSVTVGPVEPALGHRASVLTLTNCGTADYVVDGYPELRVLDAAGQPMDVTVTHGSSYVAIDPGPSGGITLAPGQSVLSVIGWSATVTDGAPATGEYVEVTVDGVAQALPLETDLGTTGEVDLTAWATEQLD